MSVLLGSLGDFASPAQIMSQAREAFSAGYVIAPRSGRTIQEENIAVAKHYTDKQWCVFGVCTLAPSSVSMILKDPDFHASVREVSPSSYPIGSKPPPGPRPPLPPQVVVSGTGQAIPGGTPAGAFSPPVLDPIKLASAGYDPVELQKLLAAGAVVGPMPPGAIPPSVTPEAATDTAQDKRLRSWTERIIGRRLTQNEQYALAAGGGLLALGTLILILRRKK